MRQTRRTILLLTMVGAVLLACSGVVLAQQERTTPGSAGNATENNPSDEVIPGQYIVVFEDGVSDPRQEAREHARNYGAEILYTYEHALKGYAAKLSDEQRERVSRDPDVKYISEDRAVQAFPKPPQSGGGSSPEPQATPTGVNRIDAEGSPTAAIDGRSDTGSSFDQAKVAVLDTGIDVDHPDLNVVGGKNCQKGRSYDDGNGHGTHVAGSIAARDDSNGVVGVAPGAPLYAMRVLDNSGSGTWSSVICGVDEVTKQNKDSDTANDIKVANMSLGGSGSDSNCGNNEDALHDAICESVAAGTTYVVAAGNNSGDLKDKVPAAYDEVLTVTAVADFDGLEGAQFTGTGCRDDQDDTSAAFSNYFTDPLDEDHTIAAPGVCIKSTWKDGGYNTISGTSMASPHTAGAAALYLVNNNTASPAEVIKELRAKAAAQEASYGFTADNGKNYGKLVYTKDY